MDFRGGFQILSLFASSLPFLLNLKISIGKTPGRYYSLTFKGGWGCKATSRQSVEKEPSNKYKEEFSSVLGTTWDRSIPLPVGSHNILALLLLLTWRRQQGDVRLRVLI